MIVLITGANGFLGEKIIKNLLIAGTKVIAVKKKINSTPKIKHKNLKWISCDLSKKKLNMHTFKNFKTFSLFFRLVFIEGKSL